MAVKGCVCHCVNWMFCECDWQ